jgi:hypothetical protein
MVQPAPTRASHACLKNVCRLSTANIDDSKLLTEQTDGGDNSCTNENPWQAAALSSKGVAGDMFWQYGDTLPSCNCQTSQDGNTVYYDQGDWTCMVTDHVNAINALYPKN